jgi:beta-phosphoglucomutase-like phosphatase (HAD superfamily)
MMADVDPEQARVRPHVVRAVDRAQRVLLDFDGVMFNVRDSLGPDAREQAVAALLANRNYRPRPLPITFVWFGVHRTMAFLAEREPDHAVEAEAVVSALEMDATLTARPAPSLHQLLAACAATGREVAVISDLSESAVLATLQAHGMYRHIAAVAARQGLDLSALDAARTTERAADLLDVDVTDCLLVSGNAGALFAAHRIGAIGLGCECGRDRRKHLAEAHAPVVSGLAALSRALLS